jgi:hypothetical protein
MEAIRGESSTSKVDGDKMIDDDGMIFNPIKKVKIWSLK